MDDLIENHSIDAERDCGGCGCYTAPSSTARHLKTSSRQSEPRATVKGLDAVVSPLRVKRNRNPSVCNPSVIRGVQIPIFATVCKRLNVVEYPEVYVRTGHTMWGIAGWVSHDGDLKAP